MKITRTANAGVLIETLGTKILVDGVCKHLPPYEKTPEAFHMEAIENPPDIVLFTHTHKDHYDIDFARSYKQKTLRLIYGVGCESEIKTGGVRIKSFPTRHIGKNDVLHSSFVIEGDKCVWFAGDSSPAEWKSRPDLPKPDIFLVPYAYTITESGWKTAKNSGAGKIVLLHLPEKKLDEHRLWDLTNEVTKDDDRLIIAQMGEELCF